MKTLDEHWFYAVNQADGRWIGRCVEWPDLHSRPLKNKLDAIDAVISLVRDRLRTVHLARLDTQQGAGQ